MPARKTREVRDISWKEGSQRYYDDPSTDPKDPIKPAGWRVVVRPMQVDDTTAGGIILTQQTKEETQFGVTVGRVVAMGPDAFKREDMNGPWCEIGDYVLYAKYGGHKVAYDGAELIILNDDGIIALVPDPRLLLARGVDKNK